MFIEPSEFPFLTPLYESAALISAELSDALVNNHYVRETVGTEKIIDPCSDEWSWDNGINKDAVGYDLREGGYSMLALYKKDWPAKHLDIKNIFPKTLGLLKAVPGLHYAAFAGMPGKGHLGLHSHNRSHLVFHVLLNDLVGGQCTVSCGSQVRALKRMGDMVLFDYSLPHETRNNATNTRLNLLIDFQPG